MSTVKALKPGKALDIAMGQGRNAVYLAANGWDVTGFDIAEEGLKVAAANAAKLGARLTTVKSRYEDFDYGKERWDLIYFVYTDAPHVDPKYVARICEALKPGGLVLIDRPFRSLTQCCRSYTTPTPPASPIGSRPPTTGWRRSCASCACSRASCNTETAPLRSRLRKSPE